MKATHYLVLLPDPLRRILAGEKTFERRGERLAAALCHSTVVLACSRGKDPLGGLALAEVDFGPVELVESPGGYLDTGLADVHILAVRPLEPFRVPGGLGLRRLPV